MYIYSIKIAYEAGLHEHWYRQMFRYFPAQNQQADDFILSYGSGKNRELSLIADGLQFNDLQLTFALWTIGLFGSSLSMIGEFLYRKWFIYIIFPMTDIGNL